MSESAIFEDGNKGPLPENQLHSPFHSPFKDLPDLHSAKVPAGLIIPEELKLPPELLQNQWKAITPTTLESELRKQALFILNKQDKVSQPEQKTEVLRNALRDKLISKLASPADLEKLDAMRLELAVSSQGSERQAKKEQIRNFVDEHIKTDNESDKEAVRKGLDEILAPASLNSLFEEINSKRPAELKAIIASQRQKLVEESLLAIKEAPKRKDFAEKLKAFDERAAACGLKETEVLATYLQIGRVLNPDTVLPHGNKSLLVRSMLKNAADPKGIDQGGHNTCNVTTMQCRLYTQEPSVPSKLVADLAINGSFTTADGTTVSPYNLNLDPDGEAKLDPGWDGSRNYASQIFQLGAINAYWGRRDTLPGGKNVGLGNIKYAQGPDGEYLLDVSVDPPQKQRFETIDASHPWLDIYGVSEINQQITGRPSKNFGIQRWIYPGDSDGVSKVVTLNAFKEELLDLKKANAFPVVISVDAAKKPFGDGKGFGPHVVTITDYDAEKGLVTVDNQWGKHNDHTGLPGQQPKVTVEEIWSSMNQLPSMDFLWGKVKDGFDGLKLKDTLPPTASALSVKGLAWGTSIAAPTAFRGGLSYLDKWGLPGAAKVLAASETRLGSAALRATSSLAAFGAFAYINDLPGAFRQGSSHGIGKLTRVTGDWASFEIGRQLTNKVTSFVPWAPARFTLSLAAGIATTTAFDKLLGEGAEIAGSHVYDRAREYLFNPHNRLPQKEQAFRPHDLIQTEPAISNKQLNELCKPKMSTYFRNKNLFTVPGQDYSLRR